MKLDRFLDDVLGSKAKVRVLRVLLRDDEVSGRELARRAAISAASAHSAAKELAALGLVTSKPVGTGRIYSINRSHHLVMSAGLATLFAEERDYAGTAAFEIVKTVGARQVASLVVFGSAARGRAKAESDVDVLVLLNDAHRARHVKESLLKRIPEIDRRYGMHLSPYVIGVGEFADRFRKGDALLRNVVREGRVVSGKPLSEVLVDERAQG